MRWEKAARLVVAAVGIGTAGAVYVLMRERPAPSKPPMAVAADPTAKMQSGAGRQVRYDGNRLLGTLTFSDFRTYDDGRVVWQTFHYSLEDGTVLSADRAESKGTAAVGDKPDELKLTGHVTLLRTADKTTLGGEAGTYSESTGQATVPGQTTFSRGRMSGTGTGGVYDRETGVFRLLADAKVTIAPEDPATVPVEATAATMTFTSAAKTMVFDENARLVREAETMTADHATLHLSDDEERFELIELRGGSEVRPVKGAISDLPEMVADDIDLGFYEDGQALQRASLVGRATMIQLGEQGRRSIEASKIDFTTARDGKTLTRLETTRRAATNDRVVVRTPGGAGVPARTITALTLVASGDDRNGLKAALFDGSVEFVETGAGRAGGGPLRRVGTSQRLTLALKGQLDAIEEARFERDVKFTSGAVRGDADIGVYRAAAGEMDLQPTAETRGRRARVVDADAGVIVEAAELVTVFLNTNNLYARRDVSTVTSASKTQPAGSSTSLFNTTDPSYGFGTEFRYDEAAETATYLGTPDTVAQLKQGNNIVNGEEIVYFRVGQDLHAKRRVDTTFDMTTSPRGGRAGGPAKPASYRVTADALTYTEKTRTASYAGTVTLRSADGATTAGLVDMILAAESRTLDKLDARQRVHSMLTGGREARGDRLVYDAERDLYELWGKPVTLVTRETDGTCYAQDGSFARFEGELGAPDFPADRNADGGAPRRAVDCPAPPKK